MIVEGCVFVLLTLLLRCLKLRFFAEVSHYDPDLTASVLTEKAAILLHLERTQEALERLTLALEIRGRVAKPRYMRGVVHMALDQYQ